MNGLRNKLVHHDKKQFVEDKTKQLENAVSKGDSGTLYRYLRAPISMEVISVGPILAPDGSSFPDRKSVV